MTGYDGVLMLNRGHDRAVIGCCHKCMVLTLPPEGRDPSRMMEKDEGGGAHKNRHFGYQSDCYETLHALSSQFK